MPSATTDRPPGDGTFRWVVQPPAWPIEADVFFSDSSTIDAYAEDMERMGWAFAAYTADGICVAAAHGVPPDWVESNSGAEAWALYQAGVHAVPGAEFRTDSLITLEALKRGKKWSAAPQRLLARVWTRLHTVFDSQQAIGAVVWIPSHTREGGVGRLLRSDGQPLTALDRRGNDYVDRLAKKVAYSVRAPLRGRLALATAELATTWLATVVGRVTWAANNNETLPHRDSAPPDRRRRGQDEAELGETVRAMLPRGPPPPRPTHLGGRVLVHGASGSSVSCASCWATSLDASKFAAGRCKGSCPPLRVVSLVTSCGARAAVPTRLSGPSASAVYAGAHRRPMANGVGTPR